MDANVEAAVVRLLTERELTLAVAESCTGGHIANRLTNVPGASKVFRAGIIAYHNDAKRKFLGVKAATLTRHGAVSEAVAREMADGARRVSRADFALATTGIAGPDGGTPDKPVGTVFVALAFPGGIQVWKKFNPFDRVKFKEVTSDQALEVLRAQLESAQNAP